MRPLGIPGAGRVIVFPFDKGRKSGCPLAAHQSGVMLRARAGGGLPADNTVYDSLCPGMQRLWRKSIATLSKMRYNKQE